MRKRFTTSVIAAVALLGLMAPAFARHDHDDHHGRGHSRRYKKNVSNKYKRYYKNQRKAAVQSAKWDWNRHNWNEQRDYMHSNWQSRSARINAAQRAQLDAQLRAQWLAYHNNNWNGSYDWNQYNDPRFWDYVHDRNPSVLTQIRNVLGF